MQKVTKYGDQPVSLPHEIFIVLHNQPVIPHPCIHEELPPAGGFALEEGDPLPEFSISNPDGTVSKKDLENKFALIIFFSTTCSDCQKAFPDISTLYHTYKDDPSVCVLLIARGETEEQVATYFREHQYNMKFFADPDLNVYSLFADNTIPRVFLADKDGTIILTQTEKVDASVFADMYR